MSSLYNTEVHSWREFWLVRERAQSLNSHCTAVPQCVASSFAIALCRHRWPTNCSDGFQVELQWQRITHAL